MAGGKIVAATDVAGFGRQASDASTSGGPESP